jgi:hypothetical protein
LNALEAIKEREIKTMKKILLAIAYMSITAGSTMAADQVFQKSKIPDAKGNQTPVGLVFSDSKEALEVNTGGDVLMTVPYAEIDRFSYEYSKKHRITQGAIVMVASVGAGAVVMLTKSRKHFLTVGYHDGDVAKELVLRLDKSEYEGILSAALARTGKAVFIKN